MSRKRRWRVVSDGFNTRVELDGVDVSDTVRAVSFDHPSPREMARVTLEVRGIDVDLDVTVPDADLDVDEACPGRVPPAGESGVSRGPSGAR